MDFPSSFLSPTLRLYLSSIPFENIFTRYLSFSFFVVFICALIIKGSRILIQFIYYIC